MFRKLIYLILIPLLNFQFPYSFPRNGRGEKALSFWLSFNSVLSFKTILLLINYNYTEHLQ